MMNGLYLIIVIFTLLSISGIILVRFVIKKKQRFNTVYDFKKDEDYKVISASFNEGESENKAEIEILKGQFAGVKYSYGSIGNIEGGDENEEFATLSFEYNLIDSNGLNDLEENEDFKNHIGEILVSMVIESAEENKKFNDLLENMKIVDEEGNVINESE